MGFFKWLINEYRIYQMKQSMENSPKRDAAFINAYYRCIEAGFTTEQMNALVTLFCSGKKGE